jgi:hypothetical protein
MLDKLLIKIDANPKAKIAAHTIIASLATSLFAAQTVGLVKFPKGELTIGEIESNLLFVVNAGCAKCIERLDDFT